MSDYLNLSFVWCQKSCGMLYDKCIENKYNCGLIPTYRLAFTVLVHILVTRWQLCTACHTTLCQLCQCFALRTSVWLVMCRCECTAGYHTSSISLKRNNIQICNTQSSVQVLIIVKHRQKKNTTYFASMTLSININKIRFSSKTVILSLQK